MHCGVVDCTDRELRTGSVCPESPTPAPSPTPAANPPSSDDDSEGSLPHAMSNNYVPIKQSITQCLTYSITRGNAIRLCHFKIKKNCCDDCAFLMVYELKVKP